MTNKINNVILYLLIIFSIYCAFIIGMSWDELIHIDRGNQRLKYLFSFGTYDYVDYRDQKFYPGFYNTLSIFITKMFPKKYEIEILHLTNTLFAIFLVASTISSLLLYPNADDPLNEEAASLYLSDNELFKLKVESYIDKYCEKSDK